LHDREQLVGGVVGVVDNVAGLIGDAGQVAGAVVGVLDGGAARIARRRWVIRFDEALAGVVLEAGFVAVAVGA